MRNDERKQGIRNVQLDWKGFIYKNYKDAIALFLIIFCILLLVFVNGIKEGVSTLLVSIASGSGGFIFKGKL
ncbi:MAG TPA: hypothetical protein VK718_01790 [Ferruginibacter sp.]|jgi:hypothetical protein|nr:hypothetical protein [Ferruginibacter sp.]